MEQLIQIPVNSHQSWNRTVGGLMRRSNMKVTFVLFGVFLGIWAWSLIRASSKPQPKPLTWPQLQRYQLPRTHRDLKRA